MNLTPRESEVLALVARGYSSKQIGSRLGVRLKTVENHRASILDKLGARNICEAVKIGVEQGILGEEVMP